MSVSAKVIADSISFDGDRLTTIEVTIHRFVLAEFNTHRVFSRNSASSRAIPIAKQLQRLLDDPAIPIVWGTNQSGMQAGEPLTGRAEKKAIRRWLKARNSAMRHAKKLGKLGVHKQITNRLLEPWMWQTIICSSTEWENFFAQRCSPLAQPEIEVAANAMRDALNASIPRRLMLGEWHLPYLRSDEHHFPIEDQIKVSVARCARVSYLTHDGVRDPSKDLEMFEKLVTADPPHWSPLEHVATAGHHALGNLKGWVQLRHALHATSTGQNDQNPVT